MNENDLKKLFIATNTDFSLQPYSNGWGGLLQYGMAVASAERKAHSSALEKLENLQNYTFFSRNSILNVQKTPIRHEYRLTKLDQPVLSLLFSPKQTVGLSMQRFDTIHAIRQHLAPFHQVGYFLT